MGPMRCRFPSWHRCPTSCRRTRKRTENVLKMVDKGIQIPYSTTFEKSYLSIRLEARSRGTSTEWSRGESRSGGNKCEKGDDLVLQMKQHYCE